MTVWTENNENKNIISIGHVIIGLPFSTPRNFASNLVLPSVGITCHPPIHHTINNYICICKINYESAVDHFDCIVMIVGKKVTIQTLINHVADLQNVMPFPQFWSYDKQWNDKQWTVSRTRLPSCCVYKLSYIQERFGISIREVHRNTLAFETQQVSSLWIWYVLVRPILWSFESYRYSDIWTEVTNQS